MKKTKFIILLSFLGTFLFSQDLTGIKICLDPGHGGHESDDRYMSETGFWESESNLTKGLFLKKILESYGATVIITRTGNDGTTDDPSLSERIGLANSNNADYFLSIHSNAFDASSNYSMSIFNGKTNSPRIPESKVMSEILCVEVMSADRTNEAVSVGDLTLNPTWSYGYGVLYPANMPANISEGSFHDYIPECWRLQSIDYRKQESWGLARAILKYFEAGDMQQKMISGILRSKDETIDDFAISGTLDKYVTINNGTVKMISAESPSDTLIYTTDDMNNGFYTFDTLESGQYTLIASAENYESDTISIVVEDENFNFADFNLVSKIPPIVKNSTLTDNEENIAILGKIELNFSRSMDTTAVASKISFQPEASFKLIWEDNNSSLQIAYDTLEYMTNYTLTLSGDISDSYNHFLDGNGDGIGGDDFVLSFTTENFDTKGPTIFSIYPTNGSDAVETMPVINITFNEIIDTIALDENIYLKNSQSGEIIATTLFANEASEKTGIQMIPVETLAYSTDYTIFISSSTEDQYGNHLNSDKSINFQTGNYDQKYSNIDKFENGVSNWWQPGQSGSTSGVNPDLTAMTVNSDTTNPITSSTKAMKITYSWDMTKSSWLLREYTPSGLKTFSKSYIMQAYIFGDGSMTEFRFCVDDKSGTEVSPWFVIDFVGWRVISWDMSTNETGSWIGDGSLDGSLTVDSFQMTYNADSEYAQTEGAIIIDDYRLVTLESVAIENEESMQPTKYTLSQNYPNPFNPTTKISYQLPLSGKVELAIYDMTGRLVKNLVNKNQNAGSYSLSWDASNLSSGVYIYTIKVTSNGTTVFTNNKKCVLMK